MVLRAYREFLLQIKDWYFISSFLRPLDMLMAACALSMFISAFLPWVYLAGLPTIGLMVGGEIPLFLSFFLIRQLLKMARYQAKIFRKRHIYISSIENKLRRSYFIYLMIGILNSFSLLFIMIFFGVENHYFKKSVDVSFGLYFALCAGLMIILGSFLQFRGNHDCF